MGEFILNLEKFITEQKQKLTADKEHLSQSSSPLDSPLCISQPDQSSYRSHPYFPSLSARSVDTAVQTDLSFGAHFYARTPPLQRPPRSPMPVAESSMRAAPRRGEDASFQHPKYGLPGLGEYEERQKLVAQEQKRELNKLYNENILSKNKPRSALDYDELLAQKREEELRYRQFNDVGSSYGKESLSAGYTGRSSGMSDGLAFQKVRSAPLSSVGQVPRAEIGDLAGMNLTTGDDSDRLPYYSQPESGSQQWQTQYRPVTNSLNADVFLADMRRNSLPKTPGLFASNLLPESDNLRQLPPNPLVGVIPQDKSVSSMEQRRKRQFYLKELELQMQEQKARNKKTVADEKEDIISTNTPLASLGGFSDRSYQSGSQRSQLNEKRASYQADLMQQMEEDRQRKTREKEEAERYEPRSDLGLDYNPWGRGGGGAPLRDAGGNLQTFRRGLNTMNGVGRPGANLYDNSPHTNDGQRKVPEKWHDGHWPLPEEKPAKPKLNYQDELREQIEEKRRRERAEKDEQRREEERLVNRLEEQRRKIQAEFDAEQEKQRRREEDQRRKNKVLIDAQNETKQNMSRKPANKEWWEREAEQKKPQVAEPPSSPPPKMRSSSPPVPSIRVQEIMASSPYHLPQRRQPSRSDVRSHSRLANATPPEKDIPHPTPEPSDIETQKVGESHCVKDKCVDDSNKAYEQPPGEQCTTRCKTSEKTTCFYDEPDHAAQNAASVAKNEIATRLSSNKVTATNSECTSTHITDMPNVVLRPNPEDERPLRPAQNNLTGDQYLESNLSYMTQSQLRNQSVDPISKPQASSQASSSQDSSSRVASQEKLVPSKQLPPANIPSSDVNIEKLREWFPEYVIAERMSEKLNGATATPASEKRAPLCTQEESRPATSRGHGDVLMQLTAMRRQLQLEQERLERQMKKDERYEVYDPRIDDRPRFSEPPSKPKEYEVYNGLDPEEIARKNRERMKQLEEWRKKDLSNPGDRFVDSNSRSGVRDLGVSGGRATADDDDDVLTRFLSNHSSEKL